MGIAAGPHNGHFSQAGRSREEEKESLFIGVRSWLEGKLELWVCPPKIGAPGSDLLQKLENSLSVHSLHLKKRAKDLTTSSSHFSSSAGQTAAPVSLQSKLH